MLHSSSETNLFITYYPIGIITPYNFLCYNVVFPISSSLVTLLANEILFVLAGVIAARTVLPPDNGYKLGPSGHPGAQTPRDVLNLFSLYIAMHVVKLVILGIFYLLFLLFRCVVVHERPHSSKIGP